MKNIQKWDFEKRQYHHYELPSGVRVILYTDNMDELISCANCFKTMTYGEGFTSRTIHNNIGFGYPVCESCYEDEWEDESRYKNHV